MTRRVQVPFIVIYLLLGAVGLMAVGILTYAISDHAAHAAADAAEGRLESQRRVANVAIAEGCNRNQLQRGYLLLRSREVLSPTAAVAKNYFPIVNCYVTYVSHIGEGTVYLSPPLQACFLHLMETKAFGEHGENVTTSPQRLHQDYNCT